MTIEEMRTALNMTKKDFSITYNIPYRTVQDWEAGNRTPPKYVVELLERAVIQDFPDRIKAYRKEMDKILKKQGK